MTDLQPDPDLVGAVTKFFAARCGPDVVNEVDRTGTVPDGLWPAVAEMGLPWIGLAEELGGSGGSLIDMLGVLVVTGAHAAPLPLAETHLAGWLLTQVGATVPAGPMTVAPGGARDRVEFAEGRLSGVLHDVPWSREAAGVVAVVEAADATHVVLLDRTGYSTRPGHDLAGQPRDRLRLDGAQVASWRAPVGLPEALRRQGALVRTAQMAGALQTVAGMTLRYTKERVQFGRPIGAFQAVQQHVVTLAQAAEITSMGLWQAARAASNRSGSFEICAAKLLADENARVATRTAHQAHGAIGMTREYPLHQYTRRLNSWRHEFGTERELAVLLGTAMGGAPSFAHALSDDDNRLEVSWAT